MDNKKRIFMSYAHQNSNQAQRIASELSAQNFDVWVDSKNLKGGNLWQEEIVKAIEESDIFLLCLSQHAAQSSDVRRELDLASTQNKLIIPLLLEEIQIPAPMQYQLAGIQWIAPQDNLEKAIEILLQALSAERKPKTIAPALGKEDISEQGHSQRVQINGDATNNVIITGDNNKVHQDQRSGGIYFEGSVRINGDVVGGNQDKIN